MGFRTGHRTRKELTPAAGADRVAKRSQQYRRQSRGSLYTCENCGGHQVYVSRSFAEEASEFQTIPCKCPSGPEEAAVREVLIRRERMQFGTLDDNHRATLNEEGESDTEREKSIWSSTAESATVARATIGRLSLRKNSKRPRMMRSTGRFAVVTVITKSNSAGRIRTGVGGFGLARPGISIPGSVFPKPVSPMTGSAGIGSGCQTRDQGGRK
jgi:hypothetical protein